MDADPTFFSFKGRLRRLVFIPLYVLIFIPLKVFLDVGFGLLELEFPDSQIIAVAIPISLFTLYLVLCLKVKRAHDIGFSAVVPIIPMILIHAALITYYLAPEVILVGIDIDSFQDSSIPTKWPPVFRLFFIFLLYAAIVDLILVFKSGTKGDNKYGLDPRSKLGGKIKGSIINQSIKLRESAEEYASSLGSENTSPGEILKDIKHEVLYTKEAVSNETTLEKKGEKIGEGIRSFFLYVPRLLIGLVKLIVGVIVGIFKPAKND